MQAYLDEVKTKSLAQGVDTPGINIWFGAYEETKDKPSLATLFLASTKRVKSDVPVKEFEDVANDEIDPINETQGKWPPTIY